MNYCHHILSCDIDLERSAIMNIQINAYPACADTKHMLIFSQFPDLPQRLGMIGLRTTESETILRSMQKPVEGKRIDLLKEFDKDS